MMHVFRDNMKIIFYILIFFFVGWMAFTLTGLDNYLFEQNEQEIAGSKYAGYIGGKPVPRVEYQQAVEKSVMMASNQRQGRGLAAWEIDQMADQVWNEIVAEKILSDVYRKYDISTSNPEIAEFIRSNPMQELRQIPEFQTDGRFDFEKYHAWLADPRVAGIITELETNARTQLPRTKLFVEVASLYKTTDKQLKDAYVASQQKAKVEYIYFPTDSIIPDSRVSVSEEEIRGYYDDNIKRFERLDMADFSYFSLPVLPSPEDTALALDSLKYVISLYGNGESWDSLAVQYSQGPLASRGGDLGWFAKGDLSDSVMVDKALSMNAGSVSEPFYTDAGFQVIRVDSVRRADGKREVKARRIMRRIRISDRTLREVTTRVRQLRRLAEGSPDMFEGVAADSGLSIASTGLFTLGGQIPGIQPTRELMDFVYGSEKGKVSYPISSTVYSMENSGPVVLLARIDQRLEAGTIPYDEAKSDIKKMLDRKKKAELAKAEIEKLMGNYASFDSLRAFAETIGYKCETSPVFTRNVGMPGIGRNNAFIGTAFGLPVGAKSDLVEVYDDFYLIQVIERQDANMDDFDKNSEKIAQQLRNTMMQNLYQSFNQELYENTEIRDLRVIPAPDSLKTDSAKL